MLLAGDIGATKTLLGVFDEAAVRPVPVETRSYVTLDYPDLADMIRLFAAEARVRMDEVHAASFGVAGPVVEQTARLTNVPWVVDARALAGRFRMPRVGLLNDLVAMAYSVPVLEAGEREVLQEGRRVASGNAALIAAGTGLGEAMLHNLHGRLVPFASEGGHADFAARTPVELELVVELTRLYGRVDCERVVSGPGLVNIHRFTHPHGCRVFDPSVDPAHAPSLISHSALERQCDECVRALDLFVAAYGAEAGNLALRAVATYGLFVGGGIAPKILPALKSGLFMDAFRAKAPMAEFAAAVPVAVILNEQAGLLGAAVHANMLAAELLGRKP